MDIVRLCERPAWIDAVAGAHVQAFGALLPDWTPAQAAQELREHCRHDGIPATWVAEEDGDWLGTVSLLHEDHADIRQYAPWLASLYVRPQARGRGVARALVAHCVDEAARLRIERLYLYCTDVLVEYYLALDWRPHDRLLLGPLRVNVMCLDPAAPPRAVGAE